MKYGYARASEDGQSVEAQVRQLTKAGFKKAFREVASLGDTWADTTTAHGRLMLTVLGGPRRV